MVEEGTGQSTPFLPKPVFSRSSVSSFSGFPRRRRPTGSGQVYASPTPTKWRTRLVGVSLGPAPEAAVKRPPENHNRGTGKGGLSPGGPNTAGKAVVIATSFGSSSGETATCGSYEDNYILRPV